LIPAIGLTFAPYSERIEGQAAPGKTLTVFSTLAPGRAFPVKVTTFERPQQMAWTGSMPLGMLKNVRTHTISPHGVGSRFAITEVISGPIDPTLWAGPLKWPADKSRKSGPLP